MRVSSCVGFPKHCTSNELNLNNTCKAYWMLRTPMFSVNHALSHNPRCVLSKELEMGAVAEKQGGKWFRFARMYVQSCTVTPESHEACM